MRTTLTPTEYEIAGYAARGVSNSQIAKHTGRSLSTIKHHLAHVFDKWGIRSRLQLAIAYMDGRL